MHVVYPKISKVNDEMGFMTSICNHSKRIDRERAVTHVLKSNDFIKLAGGFPKMFTSEISTTKGFFKMETYQGFRERFPKDADT